MMSTLEVLREGRARYAANPSHAGEGENPSPGTECAVSAVGGDPEARRALRRAMPVPAHCLVCFNAQHDTPTVLALFDRAIAVEEAKAAEFTTNTEPAEAVA